MAEAWLRGPVEGVPAYLQPVAHSLIDAVEDIEGAVEGLDAADLWARPGGVASIGFHLRHIPGSVDRLLTYARGEALTPEQLEAVRDEGNPGDPPAGPERLLAGVRDTRDRVIAHLRATDPDTLLEHRGVGRRALPSTVLGLLFHVAEHTRRHAGQVVATAGIIAAQGRDAGAG